MKRVPLCWLVALQLLAAGPVTGRLTAQEANVASLLSPESVGFVHVNVAELWDSPQFMPVRKLVANAGEAFSQEFDKRFAPGLSAIEAVTCIMPAADVSPVPTGDPTGLSGLWVIRTKKAVKAQDLFDMLSKHGRTKTYGKTDYHFDESTWGALIALDGRTLLFGSEDSVIRVIDGLGQRPAASELSRLWTDEAGKHVALAGFNPTLFRNPAIQRLLPEQLRPLFQANVWSAAIDLAPETRFVARLSFADEAAAKAGETSMRAAVDMLRGLIATGLGELKKNLDRGRGQPPLGLQEIPDSVGPFLMAAVLKRADAVLKESPVEAKGSEVRVTVGLDNVVPGGSNGLFAIASVGTQILRGYSYGGPFEPQRLSRVVKAMERYYNENGTYPPAAIYSKDGKPLLSWRVALLPYLDDSDFQQRMGFEAGPRPFVPPVAGKELEPQAVLVKGKALYKKFKLDEPWDSLHNKKLIKEIPGLLQNNYYSSRGAARFKTSVQVFTGVGTLFDGKKGTKKEAVKDGLDQTIIVVNPGTDFDNDLSVYWTKPADLAYDASKPLPALSGRYTNGFEVAFANGRTMTILKNAPEKALRALITIADGTKVKLDNLDANERKGDPFNMEPTVEEKKPAPPPK